MTDVRPVPDKLIDLDDICVLEPGDYNAKTRVMPRRAAPFGKAAKTATIEVDYEGFTSAAQQAFQRAVEIWETHVESDVTIRVEATLTDTLGTNTLGSAGPIRFWFAETDDGQRSIYPDALVDALVGDNVTEVDDDPSNDGDSEIVAIFNSEASWYYGADPNGIGGDEIDFTSVVLHELGHGLGFLGSMRVDRDEGTWGGTSTDGTTIPLIYDRFPVDDDEGGIQLINTNVYPNPSGALADALTSDHGFFDGDSTNIGALSGMGPIPPQLYFPPVWEQGSSYSHLDEAMYEPGNLNSLMTPVIGRNEAIHSPGGITCGMFADMGWPMGPGCQALLEAEVVVFEANVSGGEVRLTWTETTNADVERYVIEGRYFDGPFQPVEEVPSRGPENYEVIISRADLEQLRGTEPGLPLAGTYAFRLRLVRPDGQERPVEAVETTIQLDEPAVVSAVYPNPFANRASVSLTLQSEQRVRVAVYNEIGQRVAVLYDQTHPANDPRPIAFEAHRFRDLASGVYFFRVTGNDFSEIRSAVFVR